MTDHPLLPLPGRAVRDVIRDDLIDQLRSKKLTQVIAEKATAFLSQKGEGSAYLRRRKWAMSQIHTEAEIRAAITELVRALGFVPEPAEPDALDGGDISYHPASFWEAIGGINYVGAHGAGIATLSPDDIDWGDYIGQDEFSTQENAQEFADALDKSGIPNTGPVAGPDGTWRVYWVEAASD